MMEIRNTAASERGGWSKYYLFSVPQNSKQMLNADSSQKSDEIKIEKQKAANMLDCLLSSQRILLSVSVFLLSVPGCLVVVFTVNALFDPLLSSLCLHSTSTFLQVAVKTICM